MAKNAERNGFLLFQDLAPIAAMLDDCQRGKLLTALFAYSEDGTRLESGDQALDMAFAVFRGSIDRASANWQRLRAQRAEAGRKGGLAKARSAGRDAGARGETPSGEWAEANGEACERFPATPDAVPCRAEGSGAEDMEAADGIDVLTGAENLDSASGVDSMDVLAGAACLDSADAAAGAEAATVTAPARYSVSLELLQAGVSLDRPDAPKDYEEVRRFCRKRGITRDPTAFYAYYAVRGWRVDGDPVRDWRGLLLRWMERRDTLEPDLSP